MSLTIVILWLSLGLLIPNTQPFFRKLFRKIVKINSSIKDVKIMERILLKKSAGSTCQFSAYILTRTEPQIMTANIYKNENIIAFPSDCFPVSNERNFNAHVPHFSLFLSLQMVQQTVQCNLTKATPFNYAFVEWLLL